MKKPSIKTYRRAFQIFIAVAFIVIPILNRSRYSMVYGNFFSFHMFGIPLADPLAVLQLTVKNIYFTIDNFIGTILPLLLAFFMGTVFCSWVCPYGLFSEWVQKLRKKVFKKESPGLAMNAAGFQFKMTIFVVGFVVFLMFATTPILNQLSTAAWYARFFQYYFGQDFISLCFLFLLGLLFVEFVAGKRLWCRYICPQSILITLTKLLNKNRLKVGFEQEKCICKPGYERCEAACTLSLDPKQVGHRIETECSNCSDCIVACKKMGQALGFEFAPAGSPQSRWSLAAILPDRRKLIKWMVSLAIIAGLAFLTVQIVRNVEFPQKKQEIKHALLSNKKISWNDDHTEYFELLADGTFICVGGDWPVDGFKGWRWEPVDENGSFKVLIDERRPEIFSVFTMISKMGLQAKFKLNHSQGGIDIGDDNVEYGIDLYETIGHSHKQTAVTMNSRARLFRYAAETYVFEIEVKDYHGLLKRVPINGDLITTEVMLTTTKEWLNSPQIIVSQGKEPEIPIHTNLEIRFHNGTIEKSKFITSRVTDRSSEEFEDPWF